MEHKFYYHIHKSPSLFFIVRQVSAVQVLQVSSSRYSEILSSNLCLPSPNATFSLRIPQTRTLSNCPPHRKHHMPNQSHSSSFYSRIIYCLILVHPRIHSFIPYYVLRQVHSPFQSEHIIGRYSTSSFGYRYHLISLWSSCSCLRLFPRLPINYIFPQIMCFTRQFLRKMRPTTLVLLLFILCRIFLFRFTLYTVSEKDCTFFKK